TGAAGTDEAGSGVGVLYRRQARVVAARTGASASRGRRQPRRRAPVARIGGRAAQRPGGALSAAGTGLSGESAPRGGPAARRGAAARRFGGAADQLRGSGARSTPRPTRE